MSLEYEIKKPLDLTKINSSDMGELLWWSFILATPPEKLLSILDEVGNTAEQVRKHISRVS